MIRAAEPDITSRLRAAARWLLAQFVLDLGRMMSSDMPAIGEKHARRLSMIAYESVMQPIQQVVMQATAAGEINQVNPDVMAGGLLAVVESIHNLPMYIVSVPKLVMAAERCR